MVTNRTKSGFVSYIILLAGLAALSILLILNLEHVSSLLVNVRGSLQGIQGIKNGQTPPLPDELSKLEDSQKEANIAAAFEIYTNGAKRIFTDPKYHNLSADVYITAQDPSIIYVKKEAITWDDFFKTLPMNLSKDCLVTGTKQTFCTGENGILRFYINGAENRDTLDLVIQNQDNLTVKFE